MMERRRRNIPDESTKGNDITMRETESRRLLGNRAPWSMLIGLLFPNLHNPQEG